MTRSGPFGIQEDQLLECPKCKSTDINRSRRSVSERVTNWLLHYQQRPFYCATCHYRFWIRLDLPVWWRVIRFEARIFFKIIRWYLVVFCITALFAWGLYLFRYETGPVGVGGNENVNAFPTSK